MTETDHFPPRFSVKATEHTFRRVAELERSLGWLLDERWCCLWPCFGKTVSCVNTDPQKIDNLKHEPLKHWLQIPLYTCATRESQCSIKQYRWLMFWLQIQTEEALMVRKNHYPVLQLLINTFLQITVIL